MRAITPEDVPRIFDDDKIRNLASIGKAPPDADLAAFARSVREAMHFYIQKAKEPNRNELHSEVQALERAAWKRDFDRVAELLDGMSPRCRDMMTRRCSTPGFRSWKGGPVTLPSAEAMRDPARSEDACTLVWTLCVRSEGYDLYPGVEALERAARARDVGRVAEMLEGMSVGCREEMAKRGKLPEFLEMNAGMPATLPSAEELRDSATRDDAVTLVRRLCVSGAGIFKGRWRRRPDGTRYSSPTRRVLPAAPEPHRSVKTRDAERTLVMMLQAAWVHATKEMPPLTASHGKPRPDAAVKDYKGPFARMVQECLKLVGAPHADAVGLINALQKDRKRAEARKRARSCR
jgi:hypothetical protein